MTRSDPDWLEAMHNSRTRVPARAAHFKHWAETPARVRSTSPCTLDLSYGPATGQKLGVFPAATAKAPVLVFIHGGYWRSLDKADHFFLAPVFTEAGACVVVPNDDLCPMVTLPEIVLQMVAALDWVFRNIAKHGGDPRHVTFVGYSAGGYLAAMLLNCIWKAHAPDLPANLVKNALSISGLYDLDSVRRTPSLQHPLKLTPMQVRKASPAWMPLPARGTLFSVAGSEESAEFLRQNLLIQQAWGNKVVPVCEDLPRLNHFSVLEAIVQPGHRLHALSTQLLTQV